MAKDRGMEKFNAFKALSSHDEAIKYLLKNRQRIERPVLAEEEISSINEEIMNALENKVPLLITYYSKGFVEQIESHIKIDTLNKVIITSSIRIKFQDVLGAKCIY